jgi:hypothetical protein
MALGVVACPVPQADVDEQAHDEQSPVEPRIVVPNDVDAEATPKERPKYSF